MHYSTIISALAVLAGVVEAHSHRSLKHVGKKDRVMSKREAAPIHRRATTNVTSSTPNAYLTNTTASKLSFSESISGCH